MGGGRVDCAINKVSGLQLFNRYNKLGVCKAGQEKITNRFILKAKFIIQTVAPAWQDRVQVEPQLLTSCY